MFEESGRVDDQAGNLLDKLPEGNVVCLKDCRLSTKKILSIFVGSQNPLPLELPPSLYLIELRRSQEERQTLLKRHQSLERSKEFTGEIEVIPNVVVFQKWNANQNYVVKLTISNRLKNPLDINLICESSPFFCLAPQNTRHCKLASGITSPLSVIFSPDTPKDYEHELLIATPFSRIVIPIIAVGPRPLLDFPDVVDFGVLPVKVFSQRLLTIYNVGDAQAAASLVAECPFGVSPRCIILQPSESCALKIVFYSPHPGLFFGSLKIIYDNGDEMVVKLVSIAENAHVSLQKEMLDFAPTHVGLQTENVLKIFNETDHTLYFKWLEYPSVDTEMNAVLNMQNIEMNLRGDNTGVTVDYYSKDHNHNVILERVRLDDARQMQEGCLYFRHLNFELDPLRGMVHPRSQKEIKLLFKPTQVTKYQAKAYCDIGGADKRFPLELRGTGLGPNIQANMDVIDFDLIFLKFETMYEVVFTNVGLIAANIKFREPVLVYGGSVSTSPRQLHLKVGESRIMCIIFFSDTKGPFVEELFFDILESDQAIRILIKGKTVSPLLHFERTFLEFGRIPVGFPISQLLRIENKSPIPATFLAIVPDDGDSPSLPVWAFSNKINSIQNMRQSKSKKPMEFRVTPSSGVLMPRGTIDLEISLIPVLPRDHNTYLQVFLKDISGEGTMIPIHFTSCAARLRTSPSTIVFRYAFVEYPYEYKVAVENESDTPVFFYSEPQALTECTGIIYSLQEDYGVINANSVVHLYLTVVVVRLDEQEEPVFINIFGDPEPILLCTIRAYGIGPLVTVEPYALKWMDQPIGITSTKELSLKNICPIPAHWNLWIEPDNLRGFCDAGPWTLSEESGVLLPGSDTVIEVTARLVDAKVVKATLVLGVSKSVNTNIQLFGKGIGSSIFFHPPIMGSWDFGDVFINEGYAYPVTVQNIGTLHHRLLFTANKLISFSKTQNKSRPPITMDPNCIELEGCESKDVDIILQSEEVGECMVNCYVYATINQKGRTKLVGQSTFKVNFIFPLLMVEPRTVRLVFRLENLTEELPSYLTACCKAWTTTLAPINTLCSTNPPFSLVSDTGEQVFKLALTVSHEKVSTQVRLDLTEFASEEFRMISGLLTFTVMNRYKTRVPIQAAVLFPYITMNEPEVHIGSVEPYVELYSILHMKNKGNLTASYRWKFVVDSFKFIYVPPMSVELSSLIDRYEVVNGTLNLDMLPEWSPKEKKFDSSPEDLVAVSRSHVATRYGVLSASKSALLENGKIDVGRQSIKQNDIFKVNAHAVSSILCPILNELLLTTFSLEEAGLPYKPVRDDRPWDLDLVPSYADLPSQHQLILNAFVEPDRIGIFQCDAVCEIASGLSQTVTFIGACGPIRYRVDPNEINFGVGKFCEIWYTTFKIINIGWTSFYYEINIMSKDHLIEYNIQPRCFCVQPASKLVEPGTSVEISMAFYPGVTGPLEKYFLLSVGSAPHIKIPIKGFATFPQLLLKCPVDEFSQIPEETKYSAIGRHLCNDLFYPSFFNDKETSKFRCIKVNDVEPLCLEMPFPAVVQQDFVHPFEEGWVFVTAEDFIPSYPDILLAVERELCFDYYHFLKPKMLDHTLYHDSIKKPKSFPYFVVPGYKMDVGPVIIGMEAHYDLEILNPGPLEANFRIRIPFRKKVQLAKKGITFENRVNELELLSGTDVKCVWSAGKVGALADYKPTPLKKWSCCIKMRDFPYEENSDDEATRKKLSLAGRRSSVVNIEEAKLKLTNY